uniref:Uncharacterized protein n=1 Tax=Sparus aurata TaxID=8175 RepID=A0A671THK3_SPAAU
MCTTIMVLSTLALVLRQRFISRVKTRGRDRGPDYVACTVTIQL